MRRRFGEIDMVLGEDNRMLTRQGAHLDPRGRVD
jgi:hypothetical protein